MITNFKFETSNTEGYSNNYSNSSLAYNDKWIIFEIRDKTCKIKEFPFKDFTKKLIIGDDERLRARRLKFFWRFDAQNEPYSY